MDYTVNEILQARMLEWVAFPSSRGSSQPSVKPRSPALQEDSLPAEPQWELKNTGIGWKHDVLTTGLPGKSKSFCVLKQIKQDLQGFYNLFYLLIEKLFSFGGF